MPPNGGCKSSLHLSISRGRGGGGGGGLSLHLAQPWLMINPESLGARIGTQPESSGAENRHQGAARASLRALPLPTPEGSPRPAALDGGLPLSWLDEWGFLRTGTGATRQSVPSSDSLQVARPTLLVLPETGP